MKRNVARTPYLWDAIVRLLVAAYLCCYISVEWWYRRRLNVVGGPCSEDWYSWLSG